MGTLNDNLHVKGHLSADTMTIPSAAVGNDQVKSDAGIATSKIAQRSNARINIPLTQCRVWNAFQTLLPNPSANDDLGLYCGTWGTDSLLVRTYDVKTAGALTFYCGLEVPLPPNYEDGETVTIRLHAGMVTTVADNSCTIDVVAYESDREGGISADLCTTGAQDINNTNFADKDFTITPTDLVAGDKLEVRIAIAVNDAATGTAVIGALGSIELLCDTRG